MRSKRGRRAAGVCVGVGAGARGVVVMDAVIGLVMLTAMLTALLTVLGQQRQVAKGLAAQREAVRTLQQAEAWVLLGKSLEGSEAWWAEGLMVEATEPAGWWVLEKVYGEDAEARLYVFAPGWDGGEVSE